MNGKEPANKPSKPPSERELRLIREEGARGGAVLHHMQRVMLKRRLRDLTLDELITLWWEAQAER